MYTGSYFRVVKVSSITQSISFITVTSNDHHSQREPLEILPMIPHSNNGLFNINTIRYISIMSMACNVEYFTVHYCDVIMGAVASQITSLTIVYSTVYSDADQRKKSKLRVTGLCEGNSPGTGEFPAQMASNTENASIWWRHHDSCKWPMSLCIIFSRLCYCFHVTNTDEVRPGANSYWWLSLKWCNVIRMT